MIVYCCSVLGFAVVCGCVECLWLFSLECYLYNWIFQFVLVLICVLVW